MSNNQTTALSAAQPSQSTALGAVLESREAQQVQVAMLAAKRFPRDEKNALDRILNTCSRESLASVAIYNYGRGGTDIQGPSIRLAEAIAQHWGNMECGWREIERTIDSKGVGISTVEAYAWDLESNTRIPRAFTVRHWRDTKKGGYPLTDERDIYELCANQAARRLRACILSVVPGDIVEEAVKQCDVTLAAKADTGPESQAKILKAFEPFGVTKAMIEKRIQRRLDAITAAQVVNLRKVLTSLKDGMSTTADWFEESAHAGAKLEPGQVIDPFNDKPQAGPQPAAESATENPAQSDEPPVHERLADMPEASWGDELPM